MRERRFSWLEKKAPKPGPKGKKISKEKIPFRQEPEGAGNTEGANVMKKSTRRRHGEKKKDAWRERIIFTPSAHGRLIHGVRGNLRGDASYNRKKRELGQRG